MADLTTHLMLDDVTIPLEAPFAAAAFALAGYVDGRYANFSELEKEYPSGKYLLSITVFADAGKSGAEALDIENGDATIAQAPAWFAATQDAGKQHRDHRWYPKLYTSIDNAVSLVKTMTKAGYKRDEYMLWSAHYTGVPHICGPKTCGAAVQADATQWTDRYKGVSLDASECFAYFFEGPPKRRPIPVIHKPVPKHKVGPKRHVADGTVSLDHWLATAHLSLMTTLDTSALKLSDRNLRKLTEYLAKGSAALMPKGLVFWTEH